LTVKFPFEPEDAAPTLLADPKGFIHIFWTDKRGALYYSRTPSDDFDDPSGWGKVNLSGNVSNFDVVIDSLGEPHIAYIENVTNDAGQAGVYGMVHTGVVA
jgi:hypothetical protein